MRNIICVGVATALSLLGLSCTERSELVNPDMLVPRIRIAGGGPVGVVNEVVRRTGVRVTVELAGKYVRELEFDPRGWFRLCFRNTSLREILDAFTEMDWRFRWTVSGSFVRLVPWFVERDPHYVMTRQIGPLELVGKDMYDILFRLDRELGQDIGVHFGGPSDPGPLVTGEVRFVAPVCLSFAGGTLRELADALAMTQPNGYWIFLSKEVVQHMRGPKEDRGWLVVVNKPVLLETTTGELLEELKEYRVGDPAPINLVDLVEELKFRASEETEALVRAYWNPANEPFIYMKAEIVSALATVRTVRVKQFLLQALEEVQVNNLLLIQSLGSAVSSKQPSPEALPRLREIAASAEASEEVRRLAQSYARSLALRFPDTVHKGPPAEHQIE